MGLPLVRIWPDQQASCEETEEGAVGGTELLEKQEAADRKTRTVRPA